MQREGTLSRIIFYNEGNGYTVAVLDTEEGAIRIAGSVGEPKEGARYRLEGRFTIHPKYGEQFSFSECEELMPEGEDAIYEFLAAGNIKGIGPKTARTLVDTFGEDLRPVSENELQKVDGIGPKLAKSIRNFADNY